MNSSLRNFNYFKMFILLVTAFIFQGVLFQRVITSAEIVPDVLLVVCVLMQNYLDLTKGCLFALGCGLTADLFSSGDVGVHSLILITAAYIVQTLKKSIQVEGFFFQFVYVVFFTFLTVASEFYFVGYFDQLGATSNLILTKVLPFQVILNTVVLIAVKGIASLARKRYLKFY